MSYLYGRSAAAPMIAAAAGMRMFWGLAVDYPFAMNAAWICPLLGCLVFLPIGFAINQAAKLTDKSIWENLTSGVPKSFKGLLCGIFAFLLLCDAAVTARLAGSSSNLIALNDVTVHILILPVSIVIAAVILWGGDAVGNSARIWLKILPVFAAIMLIVQLKSYRIGWLTPVLGGGVGSIANGAIYCAGSLALSSLSWIPALPDRNKKGILRYTLYPSIAVSLLMLMQHMSFPSMINIPFTRAARIELVLSNGRMSLSPQLVLDVLWFGFLLYLLATEAITAAAFFHLSFKKLRIWIIAAGISIAVTVAAVFNPTWLQKSSVWMQISFILVGSILAALLILQLGRGTLHHEKA